jgi:putative aldouronate transport system permease protein
MKAVCHALLLSFAALCLLPMIVTISISLSNEKDILENGYSVLPRVFDTSAYDYIVKSPQALLSAYWVTIRVTVMGTILGVFIMSMAAFPLSRADFKWRKPINFYIFFTMLFNGGLVPTYIVVTRYLHLRNNLFVLMLPIMVTPWFVFLLLTYFKSIPFEMVESAKIDGANEFTI